tara:strand:- start:367 stop:783 length:417 start_codon:yes stop_codon:yes gene_type:complete
MSRKLTLQSVVRLNQSPSAGSRITSYKSSSEVERLGTNSITVESEDRTHSFKNFLGNDEPIENPNIVDVKNDLKIKNLKSSADNKFDSSSDPFYDIDETPPGNQKSQLDTNSKSAKKVLSKISLTKKNTRNSTMGGKY